MLPAYSISPVLNKMELVYKERNQLSDKNASIVVTSSYFPSISVFCLIGPSIIFKQILLRSQNPREFKFLSSKWDNKEKRYPFVFSLRLSKIAYSIQQSNRGSDQVESRTRKWNWRDSAGKWFEPGSNQCTRTGFEPRIELNLIQTQFWWTGLHLHSYWKWIWRLTGICRKVVRLPLPLSLSMHLSLSLVHYWGE